LLVLISISTLTLTLTLTLILKLVAKEKVHPKKVAEKKQLKVVAMSSATHKTGK